MAQQDCECSLDQYYDIFENTNSIRLLKKAKDKLKRKGTREEVWRFVSTLEHFRKNFRTRRGIAGDKLLQLDEPDHRNGFIELAHEYLCVTEHGSRHWPENSNNYTLKFRRDQNEKNLIDSGKRLRSKRSRDEEVPHRQPRRRRLNLESDDLTPSPPYFPDPSPPPTPSPPLDYYLHEFRARSETAVPLSQDSQMIGVPEEDGTGQAYHLPPRAQESPDELAQDHDEPIPALQHNLQQRHVNRVGDRNGILSRVSLGKQPVPCGPHTNPHERTISTGTQTTFGTDQQRRVRDADAPPPSSLDTNSNSQQEQGPIEDNHGNRANEGDAPTSQGSVEDIPRPSDNPLPHARITVPEPDFNIDFVTSYDFIPGRNKPFRPSGDIFTYSLNKFLDQVNWRKEPGVLLIILQAPTFSSAKPVTWMDWVFKNDAAKFRLVLRRFRQIALGLQSDFIRVKMDAVIEIAFERVVEGHTHSDLFDTWFNAEKTGAKL
ncbi:hypothetical protein FLONG3_8654 [Fusarium longipes]|uniref:Uncharacterized protein n=1 Tax=Fusarium longipes TaxID=694270 RepID=A0A395S3L0_9HYPO|nr:hypothetical protein FLONG3_8654 [Fusarium longipes]